MYSINISIQGYSEKDNNLNGCHCSASTVVDIQCTGVNLRHMKSNSGKLIRFNETAYIHHNQPHTIAFLVIQDIISYEMITVWQETSECLWTVNLRKLVWYPSSCIFCSKKLHPHQTMIRTTSFQTEIHIKVFCVQQMHTLLT